MVQGVVLAILRLVVLGLISLWGFAQAQAPDPAKLAGHWVGAGRFFNVAFQAEFGHVPFELQIQSDLTLTGTVGAAQIKPTPPRFERDRIDYYATLQGDIRPGSDFRNDHLVLLVTVAESDKLVADFHLKSNFVWDWTMRPGVVELKGRP
jgi:hypothetical protein